MQPDVLSDVQRALAEDIGAGDVTASLIPPHLTVTALILSREPMLVCGQAWVMHVFAEVDSATADDCGCTRDQTGRAAVTSARQRRPAAYRNRS